MTQGSPPQPRSEGSDTHSLLPSPGFILSLPLVGDSIPSATPLAAIAPLFNHQILLQILSTHYMPGTLPHRLLLAW